MRAQAIPDRQIDDLARRAQALALRYDRTRRDAARVGVQPENRDTFRRVTEIDEDAETIADLERLVAQVRRCGLGSDARPAPVLNLVPKVPPASESRTSPWRGWLAMVRPARRTASEVA